MPKFNLAYFKNKHFLALAGNGVISILSLVQMAVIYRKLEITEVGSWGIFLATLGIAESVRTGFLSTATIKFYAGTEPKRAAEVLGSVWFLAIALTGLLVLVNICFIPLIGFFADIDIKIAIVWLGVTFFSSLPYTLISWILTADERYDKILWLRMVNSGSMILTIILWVIFNKLTLESVLWINFLTNMLTNVVGFVLGMSKIKTLLRRSRNCINEIYHFGKFSMGTNLLSNMLRNTDVYIIKYMLGVEAVAIYNIPVKLLEIVEIPLRSFIMTGMSGMAIAFNQNNIDRVKNILTKYAGMLTVVFIPLAIAACFLAGIPIYILYGTKYIGTEAVMLFRIFMICSVMYPIDRFNGATLDVIHKPKINLYKVILMLIVNIISDLAGVYFLKNLYGIAIGSFLTIFSGLFFGYIQLRKYLPYTIREIFVTGIFEMKLFISEKLSLLRK